MKRLLLLFSVVLVLAALIGGITACKSETAITPEDQSILAYANPATETTLQGLSESSLAKYTQYSDAQFKAAVTQALLDQVANQINSQLGTYESKVFLRSEKQQPYVIVHYRAKYTKGDVGIRMVFDTEHLVAGQFFE